MRGGDFYVTFGDDTITETVGVGIDNVWAQSDLTLDSGQVIEILSARSLDAGDWRAAYTAADRTQALFEMARDLGVNGGALDIDLVGNGVAQVLIGVGGGANVLTGLGGADTLIGDTSRLDTADYTASAAAVQVNLNFGVANTGGDAAGDVLLNISRITGSAFGDMISGMALGLTGVNDTFFGGNGADTFRGGVGKDSLMREAGDDTLIGSGDVAGVVAMGSVLCGGSGRDSLDGGATTSTGGDTLAGGEGNDTMHGSSGDDVYIANGDETIIEIAGQGNDMVEASGTHTLTKGVEHLRLTGSAAINGIGNTIGNSISGNSAANVLTGSLGADSFVLATAPGAVDTIADMVAGTGEIHLDSAIFTALTVGALAAA